MNIYTVSSTGTPFSEDPKVSGDVEKASEFTRIFQEHAASQRSPAVSVVNDAMRTLLRLDDATFQYVTSISASDSVDHHFGKAASYLKKIEDAAEPLRQYVSTMTMNVKA